MWSLQAIADAVSAELERRDQALRAEQAVRGLDSLDELELHPIVESALLAAGYGVLREQPYPHEWRRKVPPSDAENPALPGHRDRLRCDFVLTTRPGQRLDDAWVNERADRSRKRAVRGTLFEGLAEASSPLPPKPDLVKPEDALWLECKLVTQFDCASGAAGPNRSYASQLVRGPLTDLAKLAADDRIVLGAVVLAVFNSDAGVAAHDLTVLAHKCLDRGLPIQTPAQVSFAIPDRMGNSLCTVAVIGFRKPNLRP